MDNKDQISTLNTLLATTIDSVKGYEDSAQNIDSEQLRQIFRQNADERQQVVGALREEVRRLGGDPEESGSFMGAAHQRFEDLKAAITDEINRKVFKNRIVNARDRRELKFRKEVHLSEDFQKLWEKIKHRTRYRVTFETSDLIDRALARIKQIEPIKAARVATTVVEVDITDAGVSADRQIATRVREAEPVKVLPMAQRYFLF